MFGIILTHMYRVITYTFHGTHGTYQHMVSVDLITVRLRRLPQRNDYFMLGEWYSCGMCMQCIVSKGRVLRWRGEAGAYTKRETLPSLCHIWSISTLLALTVPHLELIYLTFKVGLVFIINKHMPQQATYEMSFAARQGSACGSSTR